MRFLFSAGVVFSSILSQAIFAQELSVLEDSVNNAEVAVFLSRKDSIPPEVETQKDPYFEGYIQALIDMHYAEYRVVVIVREKNVWLANLPSNELISNSIVSFVKDVPGVQEVHKLNGVPPKDEEIRQKYVERPKISGIWFPQMTELFLPLIAAPRQVSYTVGWRIGDRVCGNQCADFSLGDDFAIYRWLDVLWHGDLQVGIEACIWSVFNMFPDSSNPFIPDGQPNTREPGTQLVNTDYYVAIPITYARDKWSFRLRGYHISSHLGDEFLYNHPNYVNNPYPKGTDYSKNPKVRVNPSIEAVDFAVSYQANETIRLYAFPGAIVHSDESFPWKPMYIEYGTEIRFLGTKFYKQKLYGTVWVGLHWRNYQELDWNFDGTYRLGYEFSKLQGIGRKFRFYGEYHHGYSLEGQFQKLRTDYWQFNLSYGF